MENRNREEKVEEMVKWHEEGEQERAGTEREDN